MSGTSTVDIFANNFYTVLASGGFSALLTVGVTFLIRNWIGERIKGAIRYEYDEKLKGVEHSYAEKLNAIEHEYAQKLETHKAQLQAASAIELEQLKTKLQIAASEKSIKLTSTFEYQRQTIETLYGGIITLNQAITNLGKSLWAETVDEKAKIFYEAKNKFITDFYPKAIYLPKNVMENVGRLAHAASILSQNYNFIVTLEKQTQRNIHVEQSINSKLDNVPQLEKNLEVSIDIVVNDFQILLGIQNTTTE